MQPLVSWFVYEQDVDPRVRGWRVELQDVLRRFCPIQTADDVLLATSELVANALEHGGGVAHVHVIGHRGVVEVEVADDVPGLGQAAEPDPHSGEARGRGLGIVASLADDWGWTPTAHGKAIWAQFGGEPDERAGLRNR